LLLLLRLLAYFMALKLFGVAQSTCTRRVLVTANELNLSDVELVRIDYVAGEHKQTAHLARQPFGQIPAFQDGDLNIFESRAIARYLAHKFDKEHRLVPTDSKRFAHYEQWLAVEVEEYQPPIGVLVKELVWNPKFFQKPSNDAVVKEHSEKLAKVLDVLDAHFKKTGHKFLLGDSVSLADLTYLPYTELLAQTPQNELLAARPHYYAWITRLRALPSWQKTISLA